MDRARKKTNKMLSSMECRIDRVYADSPALQRIQKKYEKYMKEVAVATRGAYLDYKNAPMGEIRDSLKKSYMEQIRKLTIDNKRYRGIVREFTQIMAEVNQQALDIVNAKMPEIYMLNYNQLAVDCRKAGIKVEGNDNG